MAVLEVLLRLQTDWDTPFRHRLNDEIIYTLSKLQNDPEEDPVILFQFTLNVYFAKSSDVCTSPHHRLSSVCSYVCHMTLIHVLGLDWLLAHIIVVSLDDSVSGFV